MDPGDQRHGRAADISGATSSTYTLVAADEGTTIKVKVSFTDDDGNPETRTSAATATVAAANTPATGAPTITGTARVGEALTAVTTGIMDADGLTSPSYTYQWIRVDSGTDADISGATSSTYTLVAADADTTIKVKVSFTDDDGNPETRTSAATATVAAAANNPETGVPTITGTAQVGETLTAVTTGIMDADGLTSPSYTYQWIRVNGTDADISGATSSTYTLVAADLGTTIKVKVSFTDDASNAETRTSAATATVVLKLSVVLKLMPDSIGENGGVSTVTASLNRTSSAVTTVTVSAMEVPPAVSGDFMLSTNRILTIPADRTDSTGTVTVRAVNNNVDAPNKTVTVSATATSSEEVTGPADLTLTIMDDDATPVITTTSPIPVSENETAVATLTASDDDTPSDQLAWSIQSGDAGGADADHFTLSSTGVLAFSASKDYENPDDADADRTYEVTVQVSDGANRVTADIRVTLENVLELLTAVSGPSSSNYEENGANRVATYSASSPEDSGAVAWSLSGADSGDFSIDGGVLRFALEPASPSHKFPSLPDFEAPADDGEDNGYAVTVTASDRSATPTTLSLNVTVTVTDQNEAGILSLDSLRPQLGTELIATLADPDGDLSGITWKWERSAGRSAWVTITGANTASYTPAANATGHFLRVTATYTDGHGADNTATATTAEVVTAQLLDALTATTTGSLRQLKPAFNAETLHYSIGCTDGDTMTLTPSAATGARLAVNGVRVASGNAIDVPVLEESDVLITVSGSDGASTTYTIHCLAESFPTLTVTKLDGASESLMTVAYQFSSSVAPFAIIDNNGVPRFQRQRSTGGHFRAYPDGGYPYALAAGGGNTSYTVYDAYFDVVRTGIKTVNLQHTDSHDFFIKSNGDFVLMAYEPAVRDMSFITEQFGLTNTDGEPYGTAEDTRDSVIQVRTLAGRQVFLWNSWDHMAVEDCTQHRFPDDYAHINSLQVVDGDIIASFRGCSKVLRIDGTSGEVIWRLGRSNLSTEEWENRDIGPPPLKIVGDPYREFCGQHASRLLDNGHLILFDNGVQCLEDPRTGETERVNEQFSRVVEYALDLEHGEAIFQRHIFLHGRMDSLSYAMGQADPLDNGNWLITWGRPSRANPQALSAPDVSGTQVNPVTGVEELTVVARYDGNVQRHGRMYPVAPVALAALVEALEATIVRGAEFHTGTADRPTVVVAFNRPVVDFDHTTPSLNVAGATVSSVSPHVVAGEAANAYVVTLTPAGTGDITVGLVADQPCADGGICTADGTVLSEVPASHVIRHNTPATGAPTITGTARVGETLTAVTSGIMDADGLASPSYTYQWIRVDSGTDADISGATSSTYTLVAADADTTIKVKVSFTDDDGNAETRTSAATATVVAANTPRRGRRRSRGRRGWARR